MPVPFALVCDLLDKCHKLHTAKKSNKEALAQWFHHHRKCIDAPNTDVAALLSTLLPEKRSDRVYCIKTPTLERVIGKALMLGASRLAELSLYKRPGHGVDLADCVERILAVTPNPLCSERDQITVEEIDQVLHSVASKTAWSSPSVRVCQTASTSPGRNDLQSLYRALSAREAKWFTRLVLKEYKPLILDSETIYRCCNSALPLVLKIQEDFATAINTLQKLRGKSPADSANYPPPLDKTLAMVKPKLGVKVGRQNWFKGRSIKHCLDMGHGRMSVEEKVDGEYCQFHVNMVNGKLQIQIFSKSGKDSTEDRFKLKSIVSQAIGFGRSDCTVRQGCILEGELVVHDDVENKIMPFHRIRNHVTRRGRLINVGLDSGPRSCENLMIVFYDILYLDERSLLGVQHSGRFQILEKTIRCDRGRAELVKRTLIDFHRPTGASELRKAFAQVITAKGEGLVLKPDEPYFDFHNRTRSCSGFCIKLKKEYIGAFGDVGDFAVVGAGFNPTKAKSYKIANLAWTVFYLGCLNNKEEVRQWGATPQFTVVSAVEVTQSVLKALIAHGNPVPIPLDMNTTTKLHIPKGVETDAPLDVAFQSPPVFDLRCFSFDKPGNMGFWTLRFPTVSKIHLDRDFLDAVTFDELQAMAREARGSTCDLEDSQENLQWIAKLEQADPGGRAIDAQSQLTATTMPTPSPRSSPTPLSPTWGRHRSPERSRTESQPSVNMPKRSLPTPPTSSLPGSERDSTPEQKSCSHGKRIVLAGSSPATSPSLTRRAPAVCCWPTMTANTKRRKPSAGVDGNATPNSTTTRVLFAVTMDGTHPTRAAMESPHKDQDSQATAMCRGPVKDDAVVSCTRMTTAPSPKNAPSPKKAPPAAQTAKPTEPPARGCVFAGNKCHLFGSTVLLAFSALADSAERAALLEAHGVASAVVDMDAWLEANRFGATLGNKSRSVVILVDTVERGSETEKVLASVELARRELPRKTRGWIAVYDWRMLEHLKVMEDSTMEKYYDGFHDPWRRWYCGAV